MAEENHGAPTVDGFSDVTAIGRGGFSTVFAATQVDLHRRVAIKVVAGGADSAGRLEREVRALGVLADVPNVVTPHAVVRTTTGDPALVMPLFEESLAARVSRSGPQPLDDVARWAHQLARCVDRGHARGVFHRDIKPENILLDEDCDAHLADFGIASLESIESRTATVESISPPHAPPERLRGDDGHLAEGDLYSLASTLYLAASGHPPFGTTAEGGAHGLIERIAALPLPRNPAIPAGVHDVLQRALAKDPEARFGSSEEFAEAFASAVASGADSVVHAGVDTGPVRSVRQEAPDDDLTIQRSSGAPEGEPKWWSGGRPTDVQPPTVGTVPVETSLAEVAPAEPRSVDTPTDGGPVDGALALDLLAEDRLTGEALSDEPPSAEAQDSDRPGREPARRWWLLASAVVLIMAVAGFVVVVARKSEPPPLAIRLVDHTSENPLPADLRLEVDGDTMNPRIRNGVVSATATNAFDERDTVVLSVFVPEQARFRIERGVADEGPVEVRVEDDAVIVGKVSRDRVDPVREAAAEAERQQIAARDAERKRVGAALNTVRDQIAEAGNRYQAFWEGRESAPYSEIEAVVYEQVLPQMDVALGGLVPLASSDARSQEAITAWTECAKAKRAAYVRNAHVDPASSDEQNQGDIQAAWEAASSPCDVARDKLAVLS